MQALSHGGGGQGLEPRRHTQKRNCSHQGLNLSRLPREAPRVVAPFPALRTDMCDLPFISENSTFVSVCVLWLLRQMTANLAA